jgi:hypothetical protein
MKTIITNESFMLPIVKLTKLKQRRIYRIKIIKERLLNKTYFGFTIDELEIRLSYNDNPKSQFYFKLSYNDLLVGSNEYFEFIKEVTKIIDIIERNFK